MKEILCHIRKIVLENPGRSGFSNKFFCSFQELVYSLHLIPLTTNVPHHIDSQLIYNANQLTVSYMMGNIGR